MSYFTFSFSYGDRGHRELEKMSFKAKQIKKKKRELGKRIPAFKLFIDVLSNSTFYNDETFLYLCCPIWLSLATCGY